MTWPCVIPKDGNEPNKAPVLLRFAQMGSEKFEIRSHREGGEFLTHCEGKIGRGIAEPEQLDILGLQDICDRVVPAADVYAAVHKGGLWLGPMFQVCKNMVRNDDDVLVKLQHSETVGFNQGYFMHPAMLDGTIHILGCTMIGWDAPLKIFAYMGRIQPRQHHDFSRDDSYWAHMQLLTFEDAEQTFNTTVTKEDGEVLFKCEDVAFRKVTPDQIKKAMESQMAEDDQKLYGVEWIVPKAKKAEEEEEAAPKLLVLGEAGPLLKALAGELGGESSAEDLGKADLENMGDFDAVVCTAGLSATTPAVDVLAAALRLLQKQAAAGDSAPPLYFLTKLALAVRREDLAGAAIPLHSALWGLCRSARAEFPGMRVACLDLDDSAGSAEDIVTGLKECMSRQAKAFEPEMAMRPHGEGGATQYLVSRLADMTSALEMQEPVSFSADGTYVVSGGTGSLGLLFARWMAEKGAAKFHLLSRSGKVMEDSQAAYDAIKSQATVAVCDIGSAKSVEDLMKQLKKEGVKVRGFMHAAGTLDDHLINDLERVHFERVCSAKIDGTLNLHKAAEGCKDLDTFALFSSVAALIGTAGQANYCAGNAFMDSFAAWRRAKELPADTYAYAIFIYYNTYTIHTCYMPTLHTYPTVCTVCAYTRTSPRSPCSGAPGPRWAWRRARAPPRASSCASRSRRA